jgi:hypothetical protein
MVSEKPGKARAQLPDDPGAMGIRFMDFHESGKTLLVLRKNDLYSFEWRLKSPGKNQRI